MSQKRIEILILFFTGVLTASVILIGFTTFSNLKKIEHQSEKIYQPNQIILNLKLLVSELRNSENNVRSYNLYHNEDYIAAYQKSITQTGQYFNNLYLYRNGNNIDRELLDSINSLVGQKFFLLNEMLYVRDDLKVINELNSINEKIDDVITIPALSKDSVPVTKKKKGFFNRLFGKKEKEQEKVPVYDSAVLLNKKKIAEMKREVFFVKKKQASQLEESHEHELELITRDKIIMTKLQDIMRTIEDAQNEKLKTIAGENIYETTHTNFLIRLFGCLILLILLLLAGFSVYYFYNGKQYRKRLRATAEEARRLADTREHFLSNMSHEMRTPLNSIIGFTEQLLKSPVDAEQKEQVEIIHNSSSHLLHLVNNLLDKSRIDAGKIVIESAPFNPFTIISDCISLLKVNAAKKNISLDAALRLPEQMSVAGDAGLLKQVLLNLMSNAVKFTEKGSVKVTARMEESGIKKILFVEVSDTGIGIAPERISAIFNEFEQADSSISRKYGGTGLGLAITKKIIENQGGEIKMSSTPGKGTTALIKIPYSQTDSLNIPGKKNETVSAEKHQLNGMKVLVVDDELYNRKLISVILKKYGIQILEADSGLEAINVITKNKPALALIDIHMPGMDGYQLVHNIRNNLQLSGEKFPVIAVTADLTEEKNKTYINAGINESISKPFNETELIRIISKYSANEKN